MKNNLNLILVILVFVVLACTCPKSEKKTITETIDSANTNANTNTPVVTTPTPPPTFVELKTKGDRLLAIKQENYETANISEFDDVMKPLREIPKTSKDYNSAQALNKKLIDKSSVIAAERIVLGEKPRQSEWDGDVTPVKNYLKVALNDYDSSEFVEWSPVTKVYIGKEPYWGVRLKLRAKNALGAYILRDTYYFIRNGQVVKSQGLGAD